MSGRAIFLLTGKPCVGKTTAALLITKLLTASGAKYTKFTPTNEVESVRKIVDQVYTAERIDVPWIVDDWTTYEEIIELKKTIGESSLFISIKIVYGEEHFDPKIGINTTHTIENNGSIQDLEVQLAAMLRQYYSI